MQWKGGCWDGGSNAYLAQDGDGTGCVAKEVPGSEMLDSS